MANLYVTAVSERVASSYSSDDMRAHLVGDAACVLSISFDFSIS